MRKEIYNKAETYVNIKNELEMQIKKGILLTVEGQSCTPDYIASLCAFREDSNYMRDYITDDNGNIIEIGFNDVQHK